MRWALLALVAWVSAAGAFPNEPNGFRGIAWGTPIESLTSEMMLTEERGDTKLYARTSDSLAIGGATLQTVRYAFYKGRFSMAVARTIAGAAARTALRDAVEAQFGPDRSARAYSTQFSWTGTTTFILLSMDDVRNHAFLMLQSAELMAEERADKALRAREAKKDF